jgi:LPPG:FO 2-phospho-L-lactate transferase
VSGGSSRAVTVLAGGFGGAKLSHGLALAAAARDARSGTSRDLSIIVNTGDDLELHGLAVCPDLDTVMYTLAGLANDETGWGVADETWSAAAMLAIYGAQTWFQLGDRDLATHIRRSQRLRESASLTDVTAELASALGVKARLLPMSDDPVRTEVLEAIASADLIVVAPSNPFVSVGTILAVPGILEALVAAPAPIIAVSPVVGGRALRGPADRMLVSLGGDASATGVVEHYRSAYPGLVDAFVLDVTDGEEVSALREAGVRCTALDTVMRTHQDRQRLAEDILAAWLPT